MKTISDVPEMQDLCLHFHRQGRTTGFVPTMGALHDGHLSLVDHARKYADVVVVSIFVNPLQFGPGEDLEKYPRDFIKDSRLCETRGVDVLFTPNGSGMYAPDHSVVVQENVLSSGLCGARRPGHFTGVTTVVAKLLNIVQPDVAVFGQKDAQQARVVEQMVRDLNFPVRIVVAPTVRESDGLAMSSRNTYLSSEERRSATCLSRALKIAEEMINDGEKGAGVVLKKVRSVVEATPLASLEYADVVDYVTLRPVERIELPVLVALAVKIGRTRLIDNLLVRR